MPGPGPGDGAVRTEKTGFVPPGGHSRVRRPTQTCSADTRPGQTHALEGSTETQRAGLGRSSWGPLSAPAQRLHPGLGSISVPADVCGPCAGSSLQSLVNDYYDPVTLIPRGHLLRDVPAINCKRRGGGDAPNAAGRYARISISQISSCVVGEGRGVQLRKRRGVRSRPPRR